MVLPPMRYKSGRNETISYFESIAECLGEAGVAQRVGAIIESLLGDK